jgi:hypothetical protein
MVSNISVSLAKSTIVVTPFPEILNNGVGRGYLIICEGSQRIN